VHTINGFVNISRRLKMTDLIKVETITDHEDGTATVTLNLSPETYQKIFEYGFIELIKKGIESENF
jgi:hypothetical protein